MEFFLIRFSPYLDQIRESTDQKKLFIWTLFTQLRQPLVLDKIYRPLGISI